jgi:NAD(P)-dependent dehydrogenase (short-subunit alcohol dehydrogenase family)
MPGQNLIGKTALVTGGSRGIGAAVALRLASAGADVAISYLNSTDAADSVVTQIKTAESGPRPSEQTRPTLYRLQQWPERWSTP